MPDLPFNATIRLVAKRCRRRAGVSEGRRGRSQLPCVVAMKRFDTAFRSFEVSEGLGRLNSVLAPDWVDTNVVGGLIHYDHSTR